MQLICGEDYDLSVKKNGDNHHIIVGGYFYGEFAEISEELYELLKKELGKEVENADD